MVDKKYFRCNICNDVHYGNAGPEVCPTCQNKNAYVEIDKEEAKKVFEL
jgi:rubrerythrin